MGWAQAGWPWAWGSKAMMRWPLGVCSHPAAGLLQPWTLLNSRHTMAQCRDLENHHHEKLLEIAISALEKTVKGELEEDLPDEVRAVSGVGVGAGGGARARQSPAQLCGSRKPENLRGLSFLICKRE